MPSLRNLFALLVAAVFTLGGQAEQISPSSIKDSLRAVHGALYSAFIPIDELKQDSRLHALFVENRENIWRENSSLALSRLLAPFADLRGFGTSCGIRTFLRPEGAGSFAALTRSEREHVLFLLATCNESVPRRLASTVRNFYVAKAYGAMQEQLTGIHINLSAPHDWIEQHRPQLPPTRLHYDAKTHEVVSADTPFDYLIVGSGPAGSVLAHELRRGGNHVLLVERGSFIVPGSMESRQVEDLIDARTSDDGGIIIHNGMAVGGGSQVNVDLGFSPLLPSVQAKIDLWRREGLIGPDDFNKEQLASAYEWVRSAIGTRTLSQSEINANNRVLWEGALRAGLHPKLYDLNTYPPGQSPSPVTDKRSSEGQLLIEALEDRQNPLGMIPDADVRRVLFEKNGGKQKAVGVEFRMRAPIPEDGVIADPNGLGIAAGETVIVHARAVILAAGALGSPTILLRSGVANGQIGRGVVLHPSMPVLGRFDGTIDALKGTQASVYVGDRLIDRGYAFESMSAEPAYAALMSPGPALHTYEVIRSFRNLAGFGVMLIDSPSPENRLILDEHGEPRIEYQLADADKRRFRLGVAEAVRMMFLAGAKEVYLPTTENILNHGQQRQLEPAILRNIKEAELVERNLQFIPNRSILTSAHMQATDKMGADPKDSVVGRDFHVWGTEGLYVVDGSIFPTSIGANPMQSIYTFAKIFADRMNERQQASSLRGP
ncbi:MAG: GMC family oxidoreductase [Terracidiphilus sp.]